jgi:hypothetical protein
MSTKTLRKRIALATVAALGTGVLSLVSVPAANASLITSTNIYDNATSGVASATASVGILASDVSNGVTAQTATLLATGKIAVGASAGTANTIQNITVTGGTITAVSNTNASGGAATVSGTSLTTASAAAASGQQNTLNALIAPNAGVSTMTISIFDGATTTTAVANINVTIAATSAYNVFSAAKSYVYWGTGANTDTATTDATSTNYSKSDAGVLAGYVFLKDAYGNSLSSATGLLTATATSGAVVKLGSASSAGSGTVDYSSSGSPIAFNVQQASSHVGWSGSVAFAWNGVTFATKSGTIAGEVTKVTVTANGFAGAVGSNASTSNPLASIAFADAAGNAVYPSSGVTAVSSTLGGVVNAVSVSQWPTSSQSGTLSITGATKGTQKGLQVIYTNPSGTQVTSNAFDIAIGGAPYSYKAAWDQSSYSPGQIATLTITVLDSNGTPASGYTAIGGGVAADSPTVANAPGAAVTAPATADLVQSGVGILKYKYVVSVVDGSYSAVVSLPYLNASMGGADQTAAYSVKSGSTTLNDVLKGIVSLIASINKQIAALAKLVAKKK